MRYEIGLFAEDGTVAATGWFVHVFVERASRRPAEIPPALRAALERLVTSQLGWVGRRGAVGGRVSVDMRPDTRQRAPTRGLLE